MSNLPDAYIKHRPGDSITAEDWNAMQGLVKQDIGNQIRDAVGAIKQVDHASDSDTLTGKTPQVIEDEVVNRVLEKLAHRTGYQMLFKRLTKEQKVINHGLKACPLVDACELDYFQVVCAKDDQKILQFVNFYLYHTSERKIRFAGPPVVNLEIESSDPHHHPFKIPFTEMLRRYEVKYTDKTSLEDLVNDFWSAFFKDPNDEFDEDQYCHSPWFERCCREGTPVGDIRGRGDLDDIWDRELPDDDVGHAYYAGADPASPQHTDRAFRFRHDRRSVAAGPGLCESAVHGQSSDHQ